MEQPPRIDSILNLLVQELRDVAPSKAGWIIRLPVEVVDDEIRISAEVGTISPKKKEEGVWV